MIGCVCGWCAQLCSASTCGCLWAGVGLRAALLPLAGRVRLLHLAALTSLMLHVLLLVVHVTRLVDLLPVDWNKMGGCAGGWSALTLASGGLLTLHAVLFAPGYRLAPHQLTQLLLAAAGVGVGGACFGAWLAALAVRAARAGCMAAERGSVAASGAASRRSSAYRAVPSAQPSTERDHPL
ncbi:unnamed protein product [Parnassius apollo]|uniref:(apollo) hypothetical protein n=1 Tax=Parnassius apollo TaxID=110799 RepID=A0A8S3YAJ8_PARAO|nr:unnamed protein product [Parnassius apollo]